MSNLFEDLNNTPLASLVGDEGVSATPKKKAKKRKPKEKTIINASTSGAHLFTSQGKLAPGKIAKLPAEEAARFIDMGLAKDAK